MTIDTSREAVERILEGVTPGPWEADGPNWNQIIWSSDGNRVCFMAHSNGLDVARDTATARFIAAARELVPALLAERDAALAEVARLSTPPDEVEVAGLVAELAIKSALIKMCEKIAWGSDTALMDKAADAITRLSHALAAETAKREAMEADRDEERKLADDLCLSLQFADIRQELAGFRNPHRTAVIARHAASRKEETLAKHGSKT